MHLPLNLRAGLARKGKTDIGVDDSKAQIRILEFFNQRFDLAIDFSDLDEDIRSQNEKLAQIRNDF